MVGFLILFAIIMAGWLIYRTQRRKTRQKLETYRLPLGTIELLNEHVSFFSALQAEEQTQFTERLRRFLATTAITGVGGVVVEDLDRILVGASAIIPIFRFDGWAYNNIDEVLLYKDTFSKDYQVDGDGRSVLGMVGAGALHRQMILSQPALRAGFTRAKDGHNTAIHEFVHLLDKADGSTYGVPEYLLDKAYTIPWLREMHKEIMQIRAGDSDINPYAGTNEAEFLAVAAEYFFEKPSQLKKQHPGLYSFLLKIFQPVNLEGA